MADRRHGRAVSLVGPGAVLLAVVGAFAYVGAVDPNEPGHYPACPLLRFTGLYCPGCGGLRAAHAVAHGDLIAALGSNALAVVGFAAFAGWWLSWCWRVMRRGIAASASVPLPFRPAYGWLLLGLASAFAVVRNLPAGAMLAP